MKLSNFKDVTTVIDTLKKLNTQTENAENNLIEDASENPDTGGVKGNLVLGYHSYWSRWRDGSGKSVDMTGCYVGIEVLESIIVVLKNKRTECLSWLETSGVDVV